MKKPVKLMVTKSGFPFTNLFVDQTWEQHINEFKIAEEITGITQNENAPFLIAPEPISFIPEFKNGYCTNAEQSTIKEHYQYGSISVPMFNNSAIVKQSLTKHCV